MKKLIALLVVLLLLLHHDFWFWNSPDLLAGILPVGLAYHIGISIAAAGLWWLAVTFAWPDDLIVEAIEAQEESPEPPHV